ncbi:hypothetical protein XENORESO_008685 [Xenotaenia resolanae]|uniref:Uncharacterized protein n=1 Tax=Xenotaenia resolanae TaxID=208358 RepID=A0ABV0VLJ8_9TELE
MFVLEFSPKDPSSEEDDEVESTGTLETQLLSLSQVVRDNSAEFIRHVHGSHVVRTLLHVLGGCLGPPRTEARLGAKEHRVNPELTDFEIPTSFWYELKSLTETLMENINLSVTDGAASAVFQTMLTVCHRKRPKLCKQLLNRTMEYLTSRSSAPGIRLKTFFPKLLREAYCRSAIMMDAIVFSFLLQSTACLPEGPDHQSPHRHNHSAMP